MIIYNFDANSGPYKMENVGLWRELKIINDEISPAFYKILGVYTIKTI